MNVSGYDLRHSAQVPITSRVMSRAAKPRLVARPHQLEHAAAQRREAQVLRRAQLLGRRQGVLDAVLMVVAVRRGFGGLLHAVPDLPSWCQAIIRPVPFAGQGAPMPSTAN